MYEKPKRQRKLDYYFAPKFTAMFAPYVSPGLVLETGLVWGKGRFFGFEVGAGLDLTPLSVFNNDESDVLLIPGLFDEWDISQFEKYDCRSATWIGAGFTFGGARDLGNDLQIAYGGSVGIWYVGVDGWKS